MDLKLRRVQKDDAKKLFDWANEKQVRLNSINQVEIGWKEHCSWLENKLSDPNSFLFILAKGRIDCGQIRFDENDGTMEIDFSIDVQFRNQGLGKEILIQGIAKMREQMKDPIFVSIVKLQNIPSSKLFESLGFKFVKRLEIDNVQYSKFQLE